MNKPGRNHPCPCGSGKKYKNCCLPREQPRRSRPLLREDDYIIELRPDVDEAVDRLLQRLERGEGKRVAAEITQLLERHQDYHMTNYAMGVYQATVAREPKLAIGYLEKAVAIFPQFTEAFFNLGMAARQTCDIPKAVEAFRAAERYSSDGEIAALARKELQWLERVLLKSTSFPNLDAYVANARLFDRAFECLNRGQHAEAVELFQRVLSENPKHVQSYGNLALAYAGLGRRADALACFDRALELDPHYEPAILNRRITERMREGEPFVPDAIQEIEFYADRARAERPSANPGATGV